MRKSPWEGFDLSKKGVELCKKKDYQGFFKYYQNSHKKLFQKLIFDYDGLSITEKEWIINDYDLILKCKDDYESFPQKVIKAMSIIYFSRPSY